jgi:hypothetical protein
VFAVMVSAQEANPQTGLPVQGIDRDTHADVAQPLETDSTERPQAHSASASKWGSTGNIDRRKSAQRKLGETGGPLPQTTTDQSNTEPQESGSSLHPNGVGIKSPKTSTLGSSRLKDSSHSVIQNSQQSAHRKSGAELPVNSGDDTPGAAFKNSLLFGSDRGASFEQKEKLADPFAEHSHASLTNRKEPHKSGSADLTTSNLKKKLTARSQALGSKGIATEPGKKTKHSDRFGESGQSRAAILQKNF